MPNRRELIAAVAGLGVGSAVFQRALVASAQDEVKKPTGVTTEMVKNAEWVAGIELTDAQRARVTGALTRNLNGMRDAAKVSLGNETLPAIQFNPAPGVAPHSGPLGTVTAPAGDAKKPAAADDLAFAPLTTLCQLLRTKQVSSVELTKATFTRPHRSDR